jgi:hypothetical protein
MESSLISQRPASEKKAFINHFATFLKSKASVLEQEARTARDNFNLFTSSIVTIVGLQREGGVAEQYEKELSAFLSIAETILGTIVENRTAITNFRTTVSNVPRITIQFSQAKKLLLNAIDQCQSFFDEMERGIFEITAKS